MELLNEGQLGQILAEFQSSAFRFEIRESYNSDVGREPFRKFMAGEPDDYRWHRAWLDMLRRDRAAGKAWQRVRIVDVPLSNWSRYALGVARLSVRAGDDIRYLRRDAALRLGIDPYDAWLVDDVRLIRLHFDDSDDSFAGAEVVDDVVMVQRHRVWRALAWTHAQQLEDFAADVS